MRCSFPRDFENFAIFGMKECGIFGVAWKRMRESQVKSDDENYAEHIYSYFQHCKHRKVCLKCFYL